MKFLVLGNDSHLKEVNWDLVKKSTLTVIGINRSYLLYADHDLLFLQDPKTALEIIDTYGLDNVKTLNLVTTPYFKKRLAKDLNKKNITKQEYSLLLHFLRDNLIDVVSSTSRIKHFSPFSLINAMASCLNIYGKEIKESGECVFYLYGCSLRYLNNDNNHFWKVGPENNIRYPENSPGGSSSVQLKKQLNVLKNLKHVFLAHDIEVVSCNRESPLNQIYASEDLSSVLRKNQKLKHE